MGPYLRDYTVSISDVDPARNLRLSALFRLFQEVATAHAACLGAGSGAALDKGILWVVTAQRAHILRMPRYEEKVKLSTWPGKPTHAFFPRYYRVRGEDGAPLAEASSVWVLMDAVSRKMILPREGILDLPGVVTGEETALPTPPRMGTFTGESVFTVPYSYLDLNGHMNNVRYFDLAEDLTPPELRARPIREVTVKYGGEARLGERLDLQTGREEDAWFLSGETGGRRVFRLRLEYGPQGAEAEGEPRAAGSMSVQPATD